MFSYEENEKIVNDAIHKCLNEGVNNNKKLDRFISVLRKAQAQKKCITAIHNCEYAYSGNEFIIDTYQDGYAIYVGEGSFFVLPQDIIHVESHCGKKFYFLTGNKRNRLYNMTVII